MSEEWETEEWKRNNAQRAFSDVTRQCRDERTIIHFVTELLRADFLTKARIDEAGKVLIAQKIQEEKEHEERAKIAKEEFAIRNAPERKYPSLFLARNADTVSLLNWFQKTSIEDLEKLYQQLREQPQHWSSVYHGKISEAISMLETQIAKKKENAETQKIEKKGLKEKILGYTT